VGKLKNIFGKKKEQDFGGQQQGYGQPQQPYQPQQSYAQPQQPYSQPQQTYAPQQPTQQQIYEQAQQEAKVRAEQEAQQAAAAAAEPAPEPEKPREPLQGDEYTSVHTIGETDYLVLNSQDMASPAYLEFLQSTSNTAPPQKDADGYIKHSRRKKEEDALLGPEEQ